MSGITENQIADTISPLSRALNVSEEMINIDSYSNITWDISRRRLEVTGFLITYLIQILQADEAEALVQLILSDNFTNEFINELATAFNISVTNVSVESVIAKIIGNSTDETKYELWLVTYMIGIFMCMICILFAIAGYVLRNRALKKHQPSYKQTYKAEEPTRGKQSRPRRRRRIRIVCCCASCPKNRKLRKRSSKERRRRSADRRRSTKTEEERDMKNFEASKQRFIKEHCRKAIPEGTYENVSTGPLTSKKSLPSDSMDLEQTPQRSKEVHISAHSSDNKMEQGTEMAHYSEEKKLEEKWTHVVTPTYDKDNAKEQKNKLKEVEEKNGKLRNKQNNQRKRSKSKDKKSRRNKKTKSISEKLPGNEV